MASRLQDVIQRGLAAGRPLATTVAPGTLYFATDTFITTRSDGTTWQSYGPTAFGTGDVVGPGIAVNNDFALFSGVTGKLIQDSGIAPTLAVGTPGVDTLIPTEKAIRTAIAAAVAALVSPAMVLLETHVAAASASLDFKTRNAPGQSGATFQTDYEAYLIEFINLVPATDNTSFIMLVSTDGGATFITTASYDTNMIYFASGFGPTNGASAGSTQLIGFGNVDNAASGGIAGYLNVSQPTTTVSFKRFHGQLSFTHDSIGLITWTIAAQYKATTAINAFQVKFAAGNISTGQIKVYGIK